MIWLCAEFGEDNRRTVSALFSAAIIDYKAYCRFELNMVCKYIIGASDDLLMRQRRCPYWEKAETVWFEYMTWLIEAAPASVGRLLSYPGCH